MSPKRPVVAHLIDRYLPGTATFIYQYLTHMTRYKPVVVVPFGDHPEQYPFPDLHIPDMSILRRLLIKADRRVFHRQRLVQSYSERIIRSQGSKLLHAHFGPVGVFALPLRSSLGLPLVTTFYGADMSVVARDARWRKDYARLFKQGERFLVEGSHMRDELIALGCSPEKVCILRIGVDLQRFVCRNAPPVEEHVRVLMCGSFREKKGHEYGIKAFARIRAEFPKARLRIIGDGPLRPSIVSLIKSLGLGLGKDVFLLGYLNYDAYMVESACAHIFMAPSVTASDGDSEGGAPTVLLEMQAMGLPVLSTHHADIPEVVVDGESGYLVPERDEVTLGEKLVELLAHPERWNAMGRAGRAHVERQHDITKVTTHIEEQYDTVRFLPGAG